MSLARKVLIACLLLGSWLVSSGCNPLSETTVEIRPTLVVSPHPTQSDTGWVPWPFCTYPFNPSPDAADQSKGELLVGYSHTYRDGTCWQHYNVIYQGAVLFPVLEKLGGKKFVVKARLQYSLEGRGNSCAKSLWLTETDWSHGWNGDNLIPVTDRLALLPPGGTSFDIDVTNIVNHWARGTTPNTGFIFLGAKENFDAFSDTDMLTSERCQSLYNNFVLVVTFLQKAP